MLFDLPHTLFMLISLVISLDVWILCGLFIKDRNKKDIVLKVCAWITVAIHFSSLWVDFFKTGHASVQESMLLPIYPCNIAMWLLLIVANYKNKDSKVFKVLAEITFYLGIVGGVLGIAVNEIYSGNPNLLDYGVLKGLLSHVTMLIGCVYLLVGKYIKIRVSNMISCAIGLVGLIVDGGIMIGLYRLAKLDPPNCMYLLENPFPKLPWLNTWVIGILAVVLLFSVTALYELIALKPEDRWYNKFKKNKDKGEEEKCEIGL